MKRSRQNTALVLLLVALSWGGCQTVPGTAAEKDALHLNVLTTIDRFKFKDPGLKDFFDTAHGYAVFPTVGKGGFGVGGAFGRGEVYEQGKFIGYCSVSQGSIGLQIGGQAYSELIFFERKQAFDNFTSGTFAFAAQASGVVVTVGVSADAAYENSVAVFTLPKGGLMGEAAIGGQQFDFEPK
jgi:lipid-binding SYLF domain-containing protein